MFALAQWKRLAPALLFGVGYTLIFYLWVKTFFYTLPFLIGFLVALVIQPVVRWLGRRWKISRGKAALLATILSWTLLTGALILLGTLAVREITAFLTRAAQNGFAEFSKPVAELLNRASQFVGKLDLTFLDQHKEELLAALQNSLDLVTASLSTALELLTSIPTAVTLLVVAVVATFFFTRDMAKLLHWGKSFFSAGSVRHVKAAVNTSGSRGKNYVAACLFLYFITFCETCIILAVLGLPYPLTIGVITAVADVLPILGPGMVLVPTAVYQLLAGRYFQALGILAGWLVISSIRQVVEPRLISSTVKVHPLAALAAVYFSLVAKNMWVLFYVLGLCTLYAIFRETGALPPLVQQKNHPQKTDRPSEGTARQ